MLILSQNGRVLYDTRSGCAVRIEKERKSYCIYADTVISRAWYIIGNYNTEEAAKAALRELYTAAAHGDMVEELA